MEATCTEPASFQNWHDPNVLLRRNRTFIIKNLDLQGSLMLDLLTEREVISTTTKESIQAERTNHQQVAYLLDRILHGNVKEKAEDFLNCLRDQAVKIECKPVLSFLEKQNSENAMKKRRQNKVDSADSRTEKRRKKDDEASTFSISETQPVTETQSITVTSTSETTAADSSAQKTSNTPLKGYIHNVSEICKPKPLGKHFFMYKFQTSQNECKTCFCFEESCHSFFKKMEAGQKGIVAKKQNILDNGALVLCNIKELGDSQMNIHFRPPTVSKISEVFDKTYVDVRILALHVSTDSEPLENAEDGRYKHAVIGDESGCAPFLLKKWTNGNISKGQSYYFRNVEVVKKEDEKYLKTTPFTQFEQCKNVECFTSEKEVQDLLTILKPRLHKGTVVAVNDKIDRYKKCFNCNGKMVKKEGLYSCVHCRKTQSKRKLKDEILVHFNLEDEDEKENTKMYRVFSEVLNNYFDKFMNSQNVFQMSDIQIKGSLLDKMLNLRVRKSGEVIAIYPFDLPSVVEDGTGEVREDDRTSQEEPIDSERQYAHK